MTTVTTKAPKQVAINDIGSADDFLAAVEGYFALAHAHVAVVGVGHFAGAVDDAAHNADFDALEVVGALANHGGSLLQVEERAAAAGAANVFGLAHAGAGRLQDAEAQLVEAIDGSEPLLLGLLGG